MSIIYPTGAPVIDRFPKGRFVEGEWATILYFGRWTPNGLPQQEPGTPSHEFRAPKGQYVPRAFCQRGWQGSLDANLKGMHQIKRSQGNGLFLHIAGCSVLDWWDDSSGTQPGCSSAFVVTEEMPLEEVLSLAQQAFPEILKRQPLPILVGGRAVWKPRVRQ